MPRERCRLRKDNENLSFHLGLVPSKEIPYNIITTTKSANPREEGEYSIQNYQIIKFKYTF